MADTELLPCPLLEALQNIARYAPRGDDLHFDNMIGIARKAIAAWNLRSPPIHDPVREEMDKADGRYDPTSQPYDEPFRHVERAARAICEVHGQDPDEDAPRRMICGPNNETLPMWRYYEEDAHAALSPKDKDGPTDG